MDIIKYAGKYFNKIESVIRRIDVQNVSLLLFRCDGGIYYLVAGDMKDVLALYSVRDNSEMDFYLAPHQNEINPLTEEYAHFFCDLGEEDIQQQLENMERDAAEIRHLYSLMQK